MRRIVEIRRPEQCPLRNIRLKCRCSGKDCPSDAVFPDHCELEMIE